MPLKFLQSTITANGKRKEEERKESELQLRCLGWKVRHRTGMDREPRQEETVVVQVRE